MPKHRPCVPGARGGGPTCVRQSESHRRLEIEGMMINATNRAEFMRVRRLLLARKVEFEEYQRLRSIFVDLERGSLTPEELGNRVAGRTFEEVVARMVELRDILQHTIERANTTSKQIRNKPLNSKSRVAQQLTIQTDSENAVVKDKGSRRA